MEPVYKITYGDSIIDAHWNFFSSLGEAKAYAKRHMAHSDTADYGIMKIQHTMVVKSLKKGA